MRGRMSGARIMAGLSITLLVALAPFSNLAAEQQPGGDVANGRALFDSATCSACHALADAGAAGIVGPSLDQNPNLTRDFVLARIRDGQGAMPPYAGQLTDAEIDDLTAYVLKASAK